MRLSSQINAAERTKLSDGEDGEMQDGGGGVKD